eukprot:RCo043973
MAHVVCTIDMEGTLTPEVWPYVAQRTGIEELKLTTREVPGFEKLMAHRIALMAKHNIKLADLLKIVDEIDPNPGAKDFLDTLREKYEVIIFSDTVVEIAKVFMRKLGNPTLFCNALEVAPDGTVLSCHMRITDGKRHGVEALRGLNFTVVAVGDAYNDSAMLGAANLGFWVHAPPNVIADFPGFQSAKGYSELVQLIDTGVAALPLPSKPNSDHKPNHSTATAVAENHGNNTGAHANAKGKKRKQAD